MNLTRRRKYLENCLAYFKEEISIQELAIKLNSFLSLDVYDDGIMGEIDERIMFVANHPFDCLSTRIPSNDINHLKGGNKFGFPDYRFPILKYVLQQKLLKGRKFKVISNYTGWHEASIEMDRYLVNSNKNKKVEKIVNYFRKNSSYDIFIFPEGRSSIKANGIHKGFAYIARDLGITKIITVEFSNKLSLYNNNYLKLKSIDLFDGDIDKILYKKSLDIRGKKEIIC